MAAASAPATGPASAANAGYSLPAAIALAQAAQPAPKAAMGDIYQTYNPQGAMGGLFAPAYIAGYKPSEDAVAAWQAQHAGPSQEDIDASAMPAAWQSPQASSVSAFGHPIPANQTYGQSAIDPAALRAKAWNQHYDPTARRAAIAQQVASNQAAQAAYAQQQAALSPMQQYYQAMGYPSAVSTPFGS